MNIAVGVVCWIEDNKQLPELKRCLDSLTDFYPVIVINGKWDDFAGTNIYSTNEANDLIDSYSNVIHLQSANKPEFVNRNKYLIQAMTMGVDFLFWVDTDEWIDMPLGKEFFERGLQYIWKDEKSCYFHYYDERLGGVSMQKRGVRYPSFSRHKLRHNELFFNDQNILTNPARAPRGIVINSSKEYRSESREKRMKQRARDNPIH